MPKCEYISYKLCVEIKALFVERDGNKSVWCVLFSIFEDEIETVLREMVSKEEGRKKINLEWCRARKLLDVCCDLMRFDGHCNYFLILSSKFCFAKDDRVFDIKILMELITR